MSIYVPDCELCVRQCCTHRCWEARGSCGGPRPAAPPTGAAAAPLRRWASPAAHEPPVRCLPPYTNITLSSHAQQHTRRLPAACHHRHITRSSHAQQHTRRLPAACHHRQILHAALRHSSTQLWHTAARSSHTQQHAALTHSSTQLSRTSARTNAALTLSTQLLHSYTRNMQRLRIARSSHEKQHARKQRSRTARSFLAQQHAQHAAITYSTQLFHNTYSTQLLCTATRTAGSDHVRHVPLMHSSRHSMQVSLAVARTARSSYSTTARSSYAQQHAALTRSSTHNTQLSRIAARTSHTMSNGN